MIRLARRALIAWQLIGWTCAAALPAAAGEPLMYGGIEIGAKGIKVVAVPVDEHGAPDLTKKVTKLPHVAVANVTLADRDARGNFRPEAIAETGAAVADFHRQLTGDLKIPPERLWVVASSGLTVNGVPGNMDDLRKAVASATGGEESLQEIDQRKEVELLIRGIIPRESWGDSIMLDLGSGNAKIGYLEPAVGINVEKCQVLSTKVDGTVNFTKAIRDVMAKRKLRGFAAFRGVAEGLRGELEARVEEDLGRAAGLKNRPRVYLSGGATWAIATLTSPGEAVSQDLYVRLTMKQFHEFHDKLRASGKIERPDLGGLPAGDRARAEAEVRSVLDTFTAENLLAGSEILLAFARELDWEQPDKELFFAKSGVIAWILGYVAMEQKRAG